MCQHKPSCPSAHRPDRDAARIVASHPEQGWNLLCNGAIVFDDSGELLPDGSVIAPLSPLLPALPALEASGTRIPVSVPVLAAA
ncbi:DUF5999 family protein [Streptomyces monticola]|uniref:DUF5999 family protein n=1 Tax=Streptomyces monticola TaxID=2666263 RepID=A0ABW2JKA8_9ACTN